MTDRRDFSRQSFLGSDSDPILQRVHAAVVGNGGGGSHIAQQLVHIGFGKISLFDPQRIEGSNLNRLVTATDIDVLKGEFKSNILKRYIKSVRPETLVESYINKWQQFLEILKTSDIIFGCLDGYQERLFLESFARRYLIPYVDIGMDIAEYEDGRFSISGQVIVSKPDLPCLRCIGFLTKEKLNFEENQYGHAGGNPQVVWANGILASLAVGEALKLLTPWDRFEQPYVWLEVDGNLQTVTHSQQPKFTLVPDRCPHHGGDDGIGDFLE